LSYGTEKGREKNGLAEHNGKQVLVLAPHPDDETFGCGGTIRMLTEGGIHVDVAFLTRGEQGIEGANAVPSHVADQMADVRTREAQAACEVLGVRKVLFLGGKDTCLAEQPHLAEAIANLLRSGGYQRVFCPWQQDSHEDHRATFALLKHAVEMTRLPVSFWLYEVWKPLPANTFVPIDGTMATKQKAIEKYESQLAQLNYGEAFAGLAAYRSLFCPPSNYAEAFLVCDQQQLLNLA
jgi:LmbE family N-acetylglucosaminyl deacetylase